MGLTEYQCTLCKNSFYVFPEERERLFSYSTENCKHKFKKMPPLVRCVHATEIFMLTQLDSIHTVHELNSQLMREAADDREAKQQNAARKEL